MRRAVSTTLLAGVLVALVVGILVGYSVFSLTTPAPAEQPGQTITVTRTVTSVVTNTVTTTVTQPPRTVTVTVTQAVTAAPMGERVRVRIGTAVLGDFGLVAPIAVALEKGFFERLGLEVEFVPFPGGPRGGQALVAGEIDLLSTGITDLYILKERGVDVRVVAQNNEGLHMTLVVAPDINSVEDLRGKAIGVTRIGAFTWVLANALAREVGFEVDKDITIVPLGGFDAQIAALRRGEIAAFVWGDFGAVAEALGVGKVLLTFGDILPGKWQDQPVLARKEFIDNNPDVIWRVITAYTEAWRFIRTNPDEAAEIIARFTEAPVEAIKIAMEHTQISIDGRIDLESIEHMRDFMLEAGMIKEALPVEEYIARGFVPIVGSGGE